MEATALLTVIAIGTTAIVGVSTIGFLIFSKFMKKERETGERFRAIHLDKADEEK